MTKDEALNKIATVNAMDYEYQAWAREALTQPCGLECDCTDVCKQIDYKALWQQMCERCDELDKRLAQLEQSPMHYYRADAKGNLERTNIHFAQQEPVAWIDKMSIDVPNQPLYTAPQRTWVGLTNEEVKKIVGADRYTDLLLEVVKVVEAKLKEKNT